LSTPKTLSNRRRGCGLGGTTIRENEMNKVTAALAASGVAALMLTGLATARPIPAASLTACVDGAAIVATVSWSDGRVTNGTFVAEDYAGAQPSIVQWELPHGDKSGTMSGRLTADPAYDLVVARLYAGKFQVVDKHLDVSTLTAC
jgi:hypothetical protein